MRSVILLLSLLFQIAFSQDFADKDYYLVDSLVLADLSGFDRGVVDSCLILYHQEDLDTLKLNLISFIVEESREENVWCLR